MSQGTASPEIKKVNVLGVGFSVLNLRTAVAAIADAVEHRRKGYICVSGVHGVSEAQEDEGFKRILNGAFLNTPDGMPMVWTGKYYGHREMDRVYGPDLMLDVFAWSQQSRCRHFFYGGKEGVADELAACMREKFPGVIVCGTYCPPFRPLTGQEEKELVETIARLKPDIVWVGLSTPKQERFMAEYLPKLDTTLMFGIGAAFDFHTGKVRQAPRWVQRSGLEWFFRLVCEPKRLWKRYLKNNPLFIWRMTLQISGLRKYPLES